VHQLIHELFILVRHGAQTHPYWCFPLAAAVAFSESFVGVSFIIPGTLLLISLGGVIGASHIPLWPAWIGAVLGSIAGDWISWWLGLRYHRRILQIWPFSRFQSQIEKGLQFFHRWGTLAIFLGRFLGPLRATVPLVSGMSELEFWPFMIANTGSAVIWAYALLAFPALATHYLVT
jgi:membrane protein DedA with SNARE-associated domain